MKYKVEVDSNMQLDAIVPRHIELDDALVDTIEKLLNYILTALGIKMSVTGYEYHEDTNNYKFEIRHEENMENKIESKRVKYSAYIHNSKEVNYDSARKLGLEDNEKFMKKFAYSLYKVTLDIEIDVETGETWILGVNGVELKEPVKG